MVCIISNWGMFVGSHAQFLGYSSADLQLWFCSTCYHGNSYCAKKEALYATMHSVHTTMCSVHTTITGVARRLANTRLPLGPSSEPRASLTVERISICRVVHFLSPWTSLNVLQHMAHSLGHHLRSRNLWFSNFVSTPTYCRSGNFRR